MLVRPDDRAIHEMDVPIELAGGIRLPLDRREHLVPDAGQAPAAKAAVDGGPRAVPLGYVSPGCARAHLP